jgi:hypothetical protein
MPTALRVLVSGVEHKRLPQLMPMRAAARPSILAYTAGG